jgi:hypothetical protein
VQKRQLDKQCIMNILQGRTATKKPLLALVAVEVRRKSADTTWWLFWWLLVYNFSAFGCYSVQAGL